MKMLDGNARSKWLMKIIVKNSLRKWSISIMDEKNQWLREGVNKNINYLDGIFHGSGGGWWGTPHPSK